MEDNNIVPIDELQSGRGGNKTSCWHHASRNFLGKTGLRRSSALTIHDQLKQLFDRCIQSMRRAFIWCSNENVLIRLQGGLNKRRCRAFKRLICGLFCEVSHRSLLRARCSLHAAFCGACDVLAYGISSCGRSRFLWKHSPGLSISVFIVCEAGHDNLLRAFVTLSKPPPLPPPRCCCPPFVACCNEPFLDTPIVIRSQKETLSKFNYPSCPFNH